MQAQRISEDWQAKIEAQQRHEHLVATVRIAIGEICYLAEQLSQEESERMYAVAEMLEKQLGVDGSVPLSQS